MQISRTEKFIWGVNSFLVIPASLFAVLAVFFITLSTFNPSKAHAEASSSEDAEVSLDVNSVINIATPATSTLNCTPGATSASATLCTTTANINVATNNLTGYTLQMNATNGSPTALTNTAVSPSATISTLTQSYSSANFPTNYWGYTGGLDKSSESGGYNCANNYCPILAYQSTDSNYAPNHVIKVTDAPASSSNTTITFGSKVDISKPSGTYSTSVTFTAVANPSVQKLWFQNATSANCGQTMYDNRGTDAYKNVAYSTATIGSLCWMTRNLDLPGGTKLSHADTNVPEGYSTTTAGFTNGDTLPASSTSGFSDAATAYVYNSNSTTCGDNSPCYSYYSWRAATAGYDSTYSSTPVNYDICPSGWRLPTQAEFDTLKGTYTTGAALIDSPFLGVYAGYYYSQFYNGGSYGYYWSSTARNSSLAYDLSFGSSSANVTYTYKRYGSSVRCVAQS